MRINHNAGMEGVKMRMVRWMFCASLSNRLSSAELRRRVGDVIRGSRLRWFGHGEQKDDTDWVKGCTELVFEGAGRGRLSVSVNLSLLVTDPRDARAMSNGRKPLEA